MSTPNSVNLNNLDTRYTTPATVDSKIAAQAVTDAGQYASQTTVAGKATKDSNSDITSLTGLTTPLSLSQGGTGSANASTARSNLGLGSASILNVGTTSGTVAAGDDSRIVASTINTANILKLTLTPTNTKTSAYTATAQELVLADATTASFTVTLPSTPTDNTQISVKKLDATTNTVTISTAGSDTFAIGGTTLALTLQGHAVTWLYQSSTAKWIAKDNDLPLVATDARYSTQAGLISSQSRLRRPNTVAFLGDSITDAQSYPASGGMADRNSGGGIANFGTKSIPFWALLYSKGVYTYGGVYAQSGYTPGQILATHVPQVIAAAPDACVVLAGTNKTASLTQDLADLVSIWTTLISANIKPILCTLPPLGASPVTDGSATTIRNAFIRRYARLNKLPLVDYYNALVDPSTGAYVSAYNSDNTHPSSQGARVMGITAATAIINQLGSAPVVDLATSNSGNTDLLMTRPLMLSMSGAAPQDWSILAALGTSTITNPSGSSAGIIGNIMTLTRGDTDINVVGTTVTLVAGHRYEFSLVMRCTVTTGNVQFRLENASTGGQYLWGFNGIDVSYAEYNTFYFEMLVPSGLVNGYSYRPRIQVFGAGSVFEVAQFTWRDLTANGIA